MTQEFVFNSPTDTSPVQLGQPVKEAVGVFADYQVSKPSPSDSGPGHTQRYVDGLDVTLEFDRDKQLVALHLFSKPDLPRTITIRGVEFDYRRATLQRLQAAGVQVMVNDMRMFELPELNMWMRLPDYPDELADLVLATDEGYAAYREVVGPPVPYDANDNASQPEEQQ